MAEKLRMFWSPEIEAQFNAAYEAVLQQWPVPHEEVYVPTRFGETHVIASGPKNAPSIVLLHPAGGESMIWSRNVEALSQSHRTYAVDVLGDINRSRPTALIKNRGDFADWVIDVFDGLHIDRAHLIGNSMGGYIAINAAYHCPRRVGKVVLISPAAIFVQIWSIFVHTIIPGYCLAPLLRSERLCQQSADWIWQGFPMDDCLLQLRRVAQIGGYPRYRPTHNPPPTVFSDEELRQIQNPVLLLIGDHEVLYDAQKVIRRATRLVPALQAQIVPNANHCAEYTNPDFVNTAVLEFLAA